MVLNGRIGHLHQGHREVAATASIPSKYQTIVVGNDEKKGFNSGSKRLFNWQKADESPGPAKYCPASIPREDSVSFSKKGLGGFVSKAKRFQIQSHLESSVGPAQYYLKNNGNLHDFNKAKCTSNFHTPIASESDRKKFQTPAPNQYRVSGSFNRNFKRRQFSAPPAGFMSRTKRELFAERAPSSLLAPGSYDICEKWTSVNPRVAQAPFKSTTERMLIPKSLMENPGPGTYNPHDPPEIGVVKNGFTRKHYLCIAAPAVHLPPDIPPPGPGQYNLVNYDRPKKETKNSSMFVSTTDRWKRWNGDTNPGPGTYDPKNKIKKSFMYNRDDKWI